MSCRPVFLLPVLALMLAGCSDPVMHGGQAQQVFGFAHAFNTNIIRSPDRVEAWRTEKGLNSAGRPSSLDPAAYRMLTSPIDVAPKTASRISRILVAPSTYLWNMGRTCEIDPGVRLRFTKGGQAVDIMLCFKCGELWVWRNGKHVGGGYFDPGRARLASLMKQIFPNDKVIQSLTSDGRVPNKSR